MRSFLLIVFLLLLLLLVISTFAGYAQKIAKYTSGPANTDQYTEISFWSDKKIWLKEGSAPAQQASWQGSTIFANEPAFLLMLPGNKLVRVSTNDEGKLFITGLTNQYFKSFSWVHGGGTVDKKGVCASCTLDKEEALKLIRTYFF